MLRKQRNDTDVNKKSKSKHYKTCTNHASKIVHEERMDTSWNLRCEELKQFHAEHGHCLVPSTYKPNLRLGRWVSSQRSTYHAQSRKQQKGDRRQITIERITILNQLGFEWNSVSERIQEKERRILEKKEQNERRKSERMGPWKVLLHPSHKTPKSIYRVLRSFSSSTTAGDFLLEAIKGISIPMLKDKEGKGKKETEVLREGLKDQLWFLLSEALKDLDRNGEGSRAKLADERILHALLYNVEHIINVQRQIITMPPGSYQTFCWGIDTTTNLSSSSVHKRRGVKEAEFQKPSGFYPFYNEKQDSWEMDESDYEEEAKERLQTMRETLTVTLESLKFQARSNEDAGYRYNQRRYEVYSLPSPAACSMLTEKGLNRLRKNIHMEYRDLQLQDHRMRHQVKGRGYLIKSDEEREQKVGICRVYSLIRYPPRRTQLKEAIYVQINVGEIINLETAHLHVTESQKNRDYFAILLPGSKLMAFAGKKPYRATQTSNFLKAIAGAVCGSSMANKRTITMSLQGSVKSPFHASGIGSRPMVKPKRVGSENFMDKDPLKLLATALSHEDESSYDDSTAVVTPTDPLVELEAVATEGLSRRTKREWKRPSHGRFGVGSQHQSSNIHRVTRATSSLIAANESGVIVDHSASAYKSYKRKRDEELGEKGDCPVQNRICWKWTGETSAVSDCWGTEEDQRGLDVRAKRRNTSPPSKIQFKCGVVFQGADVFEGLRKLVECGLAKTPLPRYLRDAPKMESNVITVNNNEISKAASSSV